MTIPVIPPGNTLKIFGGVLVGNASSDSSSKIFSEISPGIFARIPSGNFPKISPEIAPESPPGILQAVSADITSEVIPETPSRISPGSVQGYLQGFH